MKITAFIVMCLLTTNTYAAEPEIQKVKELFEASAYSKASANQFLELLSSVDRSSPALFICYKGVAEMMQAKYGFNPFNKFMRFKRGKKLIEEAVNKEPDNVEVRFLRFVIQTNLPALLNYNDDIDQDKSHLIVNLKTIKDKELKQRIVKYLSTSKHCSVQEQKALIT